MANLEGEDWERIGVAAALSQQYEQDEREFLTLLATLFESALPRETDVDRRGWFGKKTVCRVAVTLEDGLYTLTDPGRGSLEAARVKIVRGIALKTEPMAVPEWITVVSETIDRRAAASQATRNALARLVEGP